MGSRLVDVDHNALFRVIIKGVESAEGELCHHFDVRVIGRKSFIFAGASEQRSLQRARIDVCADFSAQRVLNFWRTQPRLVPEGYRAGTPLSIISNLAVGSIDVFSKETVGFSQFDGKFVQDSIDNLSHINNNN